MSLASPTAPFCETPRLASDTDALQTEVPASWPLLIEFASFTICL
jgi:hypothetical protein